MFAEGSVAFPANVARLDWFLWVDSPAGQQREREGVGHQGNGGIIDSIDDGCGKIPRYIKGGAMPDAIFSSRLGGITNNPNDLVDVKSKEWCEICGCSDPVKRRRAARVINASCIDARQSAGPLQSCTAPIWPMLLLQPFAKPLPMGPMDGPCGNLPYA